MINSQNAHRMHPNERIMLIVEGWGESLHYNSPLFAVGRALRYNFESNCTLGMPSGVEEMIMALGNGLGNRIELTASVELSPFILPVPTHIRNRGEITMEKKVFFKLMISFLIVRLLIKRP